MGGGSSDALNRRAVGTRFRFLVLSRARQHRWLPSSQQPHLGNREYDADHLHRPGEFLVKSSTLSVHLPKCARGLVVAHMFFLIVVLVLVIIEVNVVVEVRVVVVVEVVVVVLVIVLVREARVFHGYLVDPNVSHLQWVLGPCTFLNRAQTLSIASTAVSLLHRSRQDL